MIRVLNRWNVTGAAILMVNTVRGAWSKYDKARAFSAGDDLERAYNYDIEVVDRWARFTDFEGLDVLELGPGPDLGTGAEMLRRGARSYLAIDAYPLASDVDPKFYARFGVDVEALDYVVQPFATIPALSRTFDLVVSNACLTCVPDVSNVFADLHQMLRPGGRMVHAIDSQTLSGPIRMRDPLNIYRFSDRAYGFLARYAGMPNRMLADDYSDLASRAGFVDVLVVGRRTLRSEYVEHVAPGLSERFRQRPSIRNMSYYLLAERSDDAVDRRPHAGPAQMRVGAP